MTLAATETLDGGRVHDAQNRTSVTAGTGALPAGAYWSGGFVRDADGRMLVLVETLGAAQSAGCYFSGGFLRGPLGRLVVAQASGALSASERLSGGEVRDTAGRLVLAAGVLGAAPAGTDFFSAGLRDAVGRRYAAGLTITLAAPVNTVAPAVTPGTILTGGTLTTTNGTWTGNPTPTFTYQWQKAGVNISAATSSTYVVQAGDVGSAITCNVTATNSQGNATATSNGVTPTSGASAYRTAVLADSPISYWRLGESSGTNAADEQAVNAGAYVGAVTLGSPSLLTSDANTALSLPGSSTVYAELKNGRILAGLTNWTIEFWVKRNGASTGNGAVIYCERSTVGTNIFKVQVGTTAGSTIGLVYRADSGTLNTVNSGGSIADNLPHHVVVTKAGTAVTLYRDGVSDGTLTLTSGDTFTDTLETRLGSDAADASVAQALIVDEVAVYNTALSGTRVAAHYAAR